MEKLGIISLGFVAWLHVSIPEPPVFSKHFSAPPGFPAHGDELPMAYLESPVSDIRQKLTTEETYNVCHLFVKASEWTLRTTGMSYHLNENCPLLRLLCYNDPKLRLSRQYADFSLDDAAQSIQRRFGRHLQLLRRFRHRKEWREPWLSVAHRIDE